MELSLKQANEHLKRIPISYYLGRKIDISVTNTSASFFSFLNNSIEISLRQLNKVLSTIDEDKVDTYMRPLVFHEVSHAILTPSRLVQFANSYNIHDIMNIFEDERIETINRNAFLNTDFKKNVHLLNGDITISSTMHYFYKLVRYRQGNSELLSEVEAILDKYKSITSLTTRYKILDEYTLDVRALYDDVDDYLSLHQEEAEEKEKQDDTKLPEGTEEQEEAEEKEMQIDDTIFSDYFKSVLDDRINQNLKYENELYKILTSYRSISNASGSAIKTYSGVINPRLVTNNDYKWFMHQSREGNYKMFKKLHLTFCLDCSGSFSHHEKEINIFLSALHRLEKKLDVFSFDVIQMSEGEKLLSRSDRRIICCGGNSLDDDIYSLLAKTRVPSAENKTIVLFDGDAYTWNITTNTNTILGVEFSAFNSPNTYIISDYSNHHYISSFAHKAKTTFLRYDEYEKMFINCIMSILKSFFR